MDNRFHEAENDCTEALNLDDRYIKAYSRRSTARKELAKLKEAVDGKALFIASGIISASFPYIITELLQMLNLL